MMREVVAPTGTNSIEQIHACQVGASRSNPYQSVLPAEVAAAASPFKYVIVFVTSIAPMGVTVAAAYYN